MFLIVGLGNPDKKYEKTRHNIGFDTVDALADRYHITMKDHKHKALCGSGAIEGVKVLLAKPLTYMNLSGDSVAAVMPTGSNKVSTNRKTCAPRPGGSSCQRGAGGLARLTGSIPAGA